MTRSSERNRELRAIYVEHWGPLREVIDNDPRFSAPYLAWVHEDYEKAALRLVVVGKETRGWNERSRVLQMRNEEAVDHLQQKYREFRLGTEYSGKASFWTPVHELYRRLNPMGPELGFVALNVAKVDFDGGSPPDRFRDSLATMGLLRRELEVLEPHLVVCHTGGRKYDSWLQLELPDLRIAGDRFFSRLMSQHLPERSFRTYHPRYLNYQSRRLEVYDRILDEVRKPQP